MLAGAAMAALLWTALSEPALLGGSVALPASAAQPGQPARPADAGSERVLPAVGATSTGSHAFLKVRESGLPVGYDPCRPIHYVINPDRAPEGGVELVRRAVGAVSSATGLAFVEDGLSAEPVVFPRAATLEGPDGLRWAPVLVGWTDERAVPQLAGEIIGLAGSQSMRRDVLESERYVSGAVALDAEQMADVMRWPGGEEKALGVIMHELGHVVGLDHVDDPRELMHAVSLDHARWGPGDLDALAAVGSAPCRTDF